MLLSVYSSTYYNIKVYSLVVVEILKNIFIFSP